MSSERGSLWHKWDLHVHTPASLVHNYPGNKDKAWDNFFTDIEALPTEFKAIGINDYYFVDGYERVLEAHRAGRMSNITLFLRVVEVRLGVFGGSDSKLSRVNYHVVFSEELAPQLIREQFILALSSKFHITPSGELPPTEKTAWEGVLSLEALESLGQALIDAAPEDQKSRYSSPIREGFNNLTLDLDDVLKVLEGNSHLRGKYLTGVGKTEWADVKWQDGSIANKRNAINSADIVFTAAATVGDYETAHAALVDAGVNSRLLDCSDAHYPSSSTDKDRIGNCSTWLKANVAFRGLKQVIREFAQRVYVGEEPEQVRRLRDYPSFFMDRVRIKKRSDSELEEDWFDVDLPLNPGLVAIIGNKGSGKSALVETIGLVGRTPLKEKFSFLSPTKFREPGRNPAEHFIGECPARC